MTLCEDTKLLSLVTVPNSARIEIVKDRYVIRKTGSRLRFTQGVFTCIPARRDSPYGRTGQIYVGQDRTTPQVCEARSRTCSYEGMPRHSMLLLSEGCTLCTSASTESHTISFGTSHCSCQFYSFVQLGKQ